jgi:ATP-dependent exoDNAse (exonuclease V) alpha subunit
MEQIIRERRDGYAACASTGVAALNIGVPTLHSLFGVGAKVIGGSDDFFNKYSSKKLELLSKIKTLIIDEISMINADLIDTIDRLFQMAHKSKQQFGGVQLVMVGDVFQLGPILPKEPQVRQYVEDTYKSFWFYDALVWDRGRSTEKPKFEVFELTKSFRQKDDQKLAKLLDRIRIGEHTAKDIQYLNDNCHGKKSRVAEAIKLVTRNDRVDEINFDEMAKIKSPEVKFHAEELTLVPGTKFGDDDDKLPAERELTLKIGAHVMFVKNDDQNASPIKRWANGTTGIVTAFGQENKSVFVRIKDTVEEVETSTWTKYVYQLTEVEDPVTKEKKQKLKAVEGATFTQVPLRAAWAITIHKSQGQTYDDVIVDMPQKAFAAGQAYVALSRVRQKEGLVLTTPLKIADILVDANSKMWLDRTTILNKPKKTITKSK